MFTVTLNEAPEAYTKLVEEFKAKAETSPDGKTITLGDQRAELKRRFAHSFWLSARWEIPTQSPDGKQEYVILVPENYTAGVISIMAENAAKKALDKEDLAEALKSVSAQDINRFNCQPS